MHDDTFQWEVPHQSKNVERNTDLPSFVLKFRPHVSIEINIRFGEILSTEFKEIATAGSFRLSSELTIVHSILPYEEEICKHNSRDYTNFTSQRMRSNRQFNAVSASVLNILNQVTSDHIYILLLLTYQKQLILFLLHRVVLSRGAHLIKMGISLSSKY